MDQIYVVIASGALFLSLVAYHEVRDVLVAATHPVSMRRARVGALCASGATTALWLLLCQGLRVGA
jgi:hypothetical protein